MRPIHSQFFTSEEFLTPLFGHAARPRVFPSHAHLLFAVKIVMYALQIRVIKSGHFKARTFGSAKVGLTARHYGLSLRSGQDTEVGERSVDQENNDVNSKPTGERMPRGEIHRSHISLNEFRLGRSYFTDH